jgi:PIN domain nuclease of toxin-antitoxin system
LTENLLLDTHIALWLDNGDERLRGSTVRLIEECWRNDGKILMSAVTAREIAQLASSGRIGLDLPAAEWIERFVDDPGIEAVPLTDHAATGAYRLHDLGHHDPADRLLIATAIELGCPLVTYDARIVRFGENHGRQYGFSIGA